VRGPIEYFDYIKLSHKMSEQNSTLISEFTADRLTRGYWPATVASGCLGAFALIAWLIFFWTQHERDWTRSGLDGRQAYRLYGAFIAFAYVFFSIKFESNLRQHQLNWLTLCIAMASLLLTALTLQTFELIPTHYFDRSVGSRMGTAILTPLATQIPPLLATSNSPTPEHGLMMV
jgi:drug/metabolite transporter (DMT)-like permease